MSSGRSFPSLPEGPALRDCSVLRRRGFATATLVLGLLLLSVPLTQAQDKEQPAAETKQPAPKEKEAAPRTPQAEGTPVPEDVKKGLHAAPKEPTEEQRVQLDKDQSWFKYVEDDAPLRSATENQDEHNAYNYTIAFASKRSPESLARYSQKDVPFANLIKPIRQDYLRELIHVEGQLARVEPMKATKFLQDTEGIKALYEGWVFPKDERYPVCILFTELPEGLKPGRSLENTWVSFDGYYFKLIQYETAEEVGKGKHQWRRAPLLIGRIPHPEKPPVEQSSTPFSDVLLPGILVAVALLVVGAIVLSVWYGRGDRRVRTQIQQTQFGNNPFQPPPPAS